MCGNEIRSMMIRNLGAARLDRRGLHGVRYQDMVHDDRQPYRRAIWEFRCTNSRLRINSW